ncbi:phage tail protein [Salipiger sp. IMCC34102]|uniref:phage tail protein n=1 Tax=Salipiger sp. IMCC34102 TaxID=2510647 RepID=UPI00101DA39F|nr:phage tail protein [Salipiger sp. IMCC34102]RYH04138.1 phage tail protein [Salipiger sp. IMCC34102]
MANVMMQLGSFQFRIDTAAYQRLTRSAEARWARQTRIGTTDQMQLTGFMPESVELTGYVAPFFRGGLSQVDELRALVTRGRPLSLVSGLGDVLGSWVAESMSETNETFDVGGAARWQEFTLRIARYDGGLGLFLPVV